MPWVNIPNSVFEAGKPARALDMRNLRDNLLALAAGDVGAPRVVSHALNLEAFTLDVGTGATAVGGFDGTSKLAIGFGAVGDSVNNSSCSITIAASNDGGATWSAATTIAQAFVSSGSTVRACAAGTGLLDLATGILTFESSANGEAASNGGVGAVNFGRTGITNIRFVRVGVGGRAHGYMVGG